MQIRGFQRTTLLDYPRRIAFTVFTSGCNFRCPYCYNRHLVLCPAELPLIDGEQLFSLLKKRRTVLDGVVICGGEPTLQRGLKDFAKRVKELGFLVKLDTNGSHPGVLKELLDRGLLDFVSLDVKAPFGAAYRRATGVNCDGAEVLECMKILVKSRVNFELRTTVVPTLHSVEDLVDLAYQVSSFSSCSSPLRWYLQQFQPGGCLDPSFDNINPYTRRELEEILTAVGGYVSGAELRGV